MPLSYKLTTFQIPGQKLSNFFVGILVETMTPRGHFEINWPLKSISLPSSENSGASSFIHFASKSSNNSSQSRSEKTRIILQKYIDAVLSDDRLNQSEVIYTFLSPSPSYLKSGQYRQLSIDEEFDPRSGQKFTFPNLFKSQDKAATCSEEGGGRRLKWMDSKKTGAKINNDG